MEIPRLPQFTVEVVDAEFGFEGWVAIHSVGANGACGGMRLYPDVQKSEIQLLAEAMTHKYAFFGRQTGGAKGGYRLPFDLAPNDRRRALENFGGHLEHLLRTGLYQPWTDMNCSQSDIKSIYQGAGLPFEGTMVDSSYYTALSTIAGVVAAAEHLGLLPHECALTIEGLGNVGAHLALEIDRWGGKIIGCSTRKGAVVNQDGLDVEEIVKLKRQHGDAWTQFSGPWDHIQPDDLFDLPMTFHVPCARVHSITAEIATRLRARAIVPAANVPLTPEAESILDAQDTLLLPDFMINGGGITGTSIAELGGSDSSIRKIFLDDFKRMLVRLLALSQTTQKSPIALASAVATDNYTHLVNSARAVRPLHKKVVRVLQQRNLLPQGNKHKKEAKRLLKLINNVFC